MLNIARPRPLRGRADYGIDEPAAIRTAAAWAAALAVASRALSLFGERRGPLAFVRGVVQIGGAAALVAATARIAYAVRGKHVLRDRLIDMIEWRGDERVLDIGTGRGLMIIGAAKRLGNGSAVGIDIWNARDLSGNRAENALRNAEVEGVRGKVVVRTEDARRLSAADDSFDVIFCLRCLHHIAGVPERATACREIARVLKPGGTALIAEAAATRDYVAMLSGAGLIVERSRPLLRGTFAYLRVVAATKPG